MVPNTTEMNKYHPWFGVTFLLSYHSFGVKSSLVPPGAHWCPPGAPLHPLVPPWPLVCLPEPLSSWVIMGYIWYILSEYLRRFSTVHCSAILRFLRFSVFFLLFFVWLGVILSYSSPTNTKITFSLLKQTSEFRHLLFRFRRHLVIYLQPVRNCPFTFGKKKLT